VSDCLIGQETTGSVVRRHRREKPLEMKGREVSIEGRKTGSVGGKTPNRGVKHAQMFDV
jgi:hypothetical protein